MRRLLELQVEPVIDQVSAEKIGTFVIGELKKLDDIAYVRFASVYREFKDIDEFVNEIRILKTEN